jgi:glycosyltransferase involved in cell wall biosynthesis
MLYVSLVTRGSPAALTGGHLYHQRMADEAAAHDAAIEFRSTTVGRNPWRPPYGVPLVDSLAAWSVAPWMPWRDRRRPMAAILHQPPGGIGHGAARTAGQRRLDRAVYRRCEVLIVASAALAEELAAAHGLADAEVRIVEPGCDLPAGARPAPGELRGGRGIAVLCVGNWTPNKGVLELLDAVASLPPDDVTLHLAGRDDVDVAYADRVRARLAEPGLSGRVVVHGPLDRGAVARLFRGADAFVLASQRETYGTVYGEALAAGLPTIGWRSGNLPNLVEDGREGCLLAPGDVAGLTAVLHRLATDGPWRAQLADGARRRGARLPTWRDAADAFFDALRPLARSRG